jgi:hypothetical protein
VPRNTQGRNWSITGDSFTIFGNEGYRLGTNWVMPILGGSMEVDPEPVSAEIDALIEADVAAGKGDRIAYVGISPLTAIGLRLEGVLTDDVLTDAAETDSTVTVTLALGGKRRKVAIMQDADHHIATFDEDGNVV